MNWSVTKLLRKDFLTLVNGRKADSVESNNGGEGGVKQGVGVCCSRDEWVHFLNT